MSDSNCATRIPGFTHNGDCNLICKPSDWKDILVFFLGNYAAHAAIVIGRPDQSSLTWAFSLVLALFFPGAGVLTGVTAIASLALFAPTELTKAARAGALCIVVRAADGEQDGADSERQQLPSASPRAREACTPQTSHDASRADRHDASRADQHEESQADHHGASQADQHDAPETDRHDASQGDQHNASQAGEHDPHPRGHGHVGGAQPSLDHIRRPSVRAASDQQSVADAHETLDGRPDEALPSSMTASLVHGLARLPAGYRLLVLPGWTTFEHDHDGDGNEQSTPPAPESLPGQFWHSLSSPFTTQTRLTSTVPCSYNAVKALISIGQLLYSVLTLYETRGNQLAVFGYAAFGLTVTPYFWMSLVNLLGNLMCPQYPSIFIVNSPTLDRLRHRVEDRGLVHRYSFDGTVGRISAETEARVLQTNGHLLKYTTALEVLFNRLDPDKSPETGKLVSQAIVAYFVAAVPIAIVGGLSRFDPGQSAAYQRLWTMIWLCFGPMVGIGYGMWVLPLFESWPVLWRSMMIRKTDELSDDARVLGHEKKAPTQGSREEKDAREGSSAHGTGEAPRVVILTQLARFALAAVFVSVYMAPAVGGFVVVGQMLMQYGTCNKIK